MSSLSASNRSAVGVPSRSDVGVATGLEALGDKIDPLQIEGAANAMLKEGVLISRMSFTEGTAISIRTPKIGMNKRGMSSIPTK